MQTYAFVFNDNVIRVMRVPDGADPYVAYGRQLPDGDWILCADDIQPGDSYNGADWILAPRPLMPITKLAFLRRFTPQERIAISASDDPIIRDFLHMLEMSSEVRLDDVDVIAAVDYLKVQNLLTTGRAAEILT